jgi:hypothetical protein
MRVGHGSLAVVAALSLTLGASAQDWPSFRGPGAQGIVYRERTGTTHSASPVASDGKVYLAGEAGAAGYCASPRSSPCHACLG